MLASRPPLILALDATWTQCSAALWADGAILASTERAGRTGEAAFLPRMVADLLADQGRSAADLAAVAVTVGPGSFTGLRASLALAEGLATGASRAGAGRAVIGVTVAEALAVAARAEGGVGPDRPLWCALDARQGRIFLHRGGTPEAWEVANLDPPPLPDRPVALTGDAAEALALALRAAGMDAVVTAARQPHARDVARAARLRADGLLPPLVPRPLYIDPPRALVPRGGLRPPPCAMSVPS